MKMYKQDILEKRPAIKGRFRNWLYVAARRHGVDEWRKLNRRHEQSAAPGDPEPVDPGFGGPDDAPFDADLFYALSILHMTVARVRKHLMEDGKSEHWMIFEELVLAPLIPGRVPKSRDALLAMFPGQPPGFLDNRLTTVKRVSGAFFRRSCPLTRPIPSRPTNDWKNCWKSCGLHSPAGCGWRLLAKPAPEPGESTGSSDDLAMPSSVDEIPEGRIPPEVMHDELRVLLGFWLAMPLNDYLDDLEGAGPTIARVIRDSRPRGAPGPAESLAPCLNLLGLCDRVHPTIAAIPPGELVNVFERLKTYAKRVHRQAAHAEKARASGAAANRRETSMPVEIAQVLYDLAGALALSRAGRGSSGSVTSATERMCPGC